MIDVAVISCAKEEVEMWEGKCLGGEDDNGRGVVGRAGVGQEGLDKYSLCPPLASHPTGGTRVSYCSPLEPEVGAA